MVAPWCVRVARKSAASAQQGVTLIRLSRTKLQAVERMDASIDEDEDEMAVPGPAPAATTTDGAPAASSSEDAAQE